MTCATRVSTAPGIWSASRPSAPRSLVPENPARTADASTTTIALWPTSVSQTKKREARAKEPATARAPGSSSATTRIGRASRTSTRAEIAPKTKMPASTTCTARLPRASARNCRARANTARTPTEIATTACSATAHRRPASRPCQSEVSAPTTGSASQAIVKTTGAWQATRLIACRLRGRHPPLTGAELDGQLAFFCRFRLCYTPPDLQASRPNASQVGCSQRVRADMALPPPHQAPFVTPTVDRAAVHASGTYPCRGEGGAASHHLRLPLTPAVLSTGVSAHPASSSPSLASMPAVPEDDVGASVNSRGNDWYRAC